VEKPTELYGKVASVADIPAGKCKVVYAFQKEIALFNVAGEFFAVSNHCPHRNAPLSTGTVDEYTVICPYHEARFDLRSGQGLPGPHRANIPCYKVKVDGPYIFIAR
jgi:nitrite reductase/ring-hydroxylating ferredoxin subunit